MDLLKSARVFLMESLSEYHKPDKMVFSILHGMIALELLLKERLYRINPNLIYANIDVDIEPKSHKKHTKSKYTVQLSVIPARLKNLGVNLEKEEIELIDEVAGWRNSIVHHVPMHNNKDANLKLGRLYNFIFNFLVNELNQEFHVFLPREHYESMEKIIEVLGKQIAVARKKSQDSGQSDNQHSCSVCGITGVVEIRGETAAFCHLCNRNLIKMVCSGCDNTLNAYSSEEGIHEDLCRDCMSRAEDTYTNQQIDLLRGK